MNNIGKKNKKIERQRAWQGQKVRHFERYIDACVRLYPSKLRLKDIIESFGMFKLLFRIMLVMLGARVLKVCLMDDETSIFFP